MVKRITGCSILSKDRTRRHLPLSVDDVKEEAGIADFHHVGDPEAANCFGDGRLHQRPVEFSAERPDLGALRARAAGKLDVD
jgi:hypothetical protein